MRYSQVLPIGLLWTAPFRPALLWDRPDCGIGRRVSSNLALDGHCLRCRLIGLLYSFSTALWELVSKTVLYLSSLAQALSPFSHVDDTGRTKDIWFEAHLLKIGEHLSHHRRWWNWRKRYNTTTIIIVLYEGRTVIFFILPAVLYHKCSLGSQKCLIALEVHCIFLYAFQSSQGNDVLRGQCVIRNTWLNLVTYCFFCFSMRRVLCA